MVVHALPKGYSVRQLSSVEHVHAAAELVGRTRTEEEAGAFDLAQSIAAYKRQFTWLTRQTRGGVFGVFNAENELTAAGGLAPISMLKEQYHGLTDEASRAKHAASEAGIREYEAIVGAQTGTPVSRERIGLLFGLAVRPTERGKHLASVLLAERLPIAAKHFDHVLTSTVNPKVMRALEAEGFQHVADKPIGAKTFRVYYKAVTKPA